MLFMKPRVTSQILHTTIICIIAHNKKIPGKNKISQFLFSQWSFFCTKTYLIKVHSNLWRAMSKNSQKLLSYYIN